jgi:hypothetical protein
MPVDKNPSDDFVSQAGKGCGTTLIIVVVVIGLLLWAVTSALKGL